MNRFQAIEIASAKLESLGFELSGVSGQSESRYFSRPGRDATLRLSCHGRRSSLSLVIASLLFHDDDSVERVGAYVGNRSAAEIEAMAEEAAAEYDGSDEDESEELSDEELEAHLRSATL